VLEDAGEPDQLNDAVRRLLAVALPPVSLTHSAICSSEPPPEGASCAPFERSSLSRAR
jgi:hypothetical protein